MATSLEDERSQLGNRTSLFARLERVERSLDHLGLVGFMLDGGRCRDRERDIDAVLSCLDRVNALQPSST